MFINVITTLHRHDYMIQGLLVDFFFLGLYTRFPDLSFSGFAPHTGSFSLCKYDFFQVINIFGNELKICQLANNTTLFKKK